jgi:hypothetical protein
MEAQSALPLSLVVQSHVAACSYSLYRNNLLMAVNEGLTVWVMLGTKKKLLWSHGSMENTPSKLSSVSSGPPSLSLSLSLWERAAISRDCRMQITRSPRLPSLSAGACHPSTSAARHSDIKELFYGLRLWLWTWGMRTPLSTRTHPRGYTKTSYWVGKIKSIYTGIYMISW